jgi:RHS repeat-associated protein
MSHTLPNGIVTEYAYDAASRLTELTYKLGGNTLGTLTYDYNTAGERVTVGGTWARTVQPAAIATATYNAANQQATFGGQTLTYDLNGNLITDGTNTYTWNTRNQLATITGPTPAMFVYDGLGRRKQRTVTGATTDFLYDGFNVVQEQTAGTTTNVLTGLGIDERFRQSNATETRHLLEDALGSTIRLADDIGNPQTTYTYEPFGATTVTGGSTTNTYGYTGRENDGTALYYYRARYYHPALQRFISEDPLEFAGGVNVYAYALNRPISLTDPLGLFTLSVCVKISAAFGVAGGGGTCINGGYDRKDGFSMSLTGTAGVGGGGVGAAVGGSIAWSNAPSVAQLNGPFVSGGVGGGAGLVGSVSGFVGQGSRGTITGGEIFGGLGLKLPNTVAPPVAVEGGVTTTSTIVGVSRRGLVFFQP